MKKIILLVLLFNAYLGFTQCTFNLNLTVNHASDSSVCDGSIIAIPVGNNGPVTYTWNCNGCINTNSSNLTGLCFGANGTVIATDSTGCTATSMWNIGISPCSNFGASVYPSSTTGPNGCDGSILVTPFGGTAPYNYAIGNGVVNYSSNNPSNLCTGNYTVNVSDANGCSMSTITNVDVICNLSVNISIVSFPSSLSSCNGVISTNIFGQVGVPAYSWNTGDSSSVLEGLCPGSYQVCVTDGYGCQICDSITLYDSSYVNCALYSANLNITNVSASSLCDGSIDPIILGGTVPYVYLWSNGSTNSTITNLCTGQYDLTVTDGNGCSTSASGYVGEDGANVGDTIILNGSIGADSSVLGTISGPWIVNCNFDYNTITNAFVTSYVDLLDSTVVTWTLLFNDGTSTTLNATYSFSPGTAGTYNVLLQLYCGLKSNPLWLIAYDQMIYEGTSGIDNLSENSISIYPNPSNDHITIDAGDLTTMNGYSIKIEDAQGQQVFQNAVNQQQFNIDITSWGGNGLYFVRIIDPQGNTVDIKKIVLQ